MHGHAHSGGSGDLHHHGHSHRTGVATRYWREPKPLAVTVVIFFILLWSSGLGRGSNKLAGNEALLNKGVVTLPERTRLVVWHDGGTNIDPIDGVYARSFEGDLFTSCEAINQTATNKVSKLELANVKLTYCSTLECLWVFSQLLQHVKGVQHVVSSSLAKQLYGGDRSGDEWTKGTIEDNGSFARLVEQEARRALSLTTDVSGQTEIPCRQFPYVQTKPMGITECSHPSDRQCDAKCPLNHSFYRSDIRMCVTGSVCSMLTTKACLDSEIYSSCKRDCATLFFREVRIEGTRDTTVAICLVTLNLLGFVLGLLFAKLYWVDPLLDENERLKGVADHGHSHSMDDDHHRH